MFSNGKILSGCESKPSPPQQSKDIHDHCASATLAKHHQCLNRLVKGEGFEAAWMLCILLPIESVTENKTTSFFLFKMGELKKPVDEGKIKYVGLSEASASTIRRAHAVHPITDVQSEWSLWSRDVEEEIVPTCRELGIGIGIVAHSPLGRILVRVYRMMISERQNLPRFQPENPDHNKQLFERVKQIAERKGCTPSHLALAWVHHHGEDVCPIPETTKIQNFNQNIGDLSVKLTPREISELESIVSADAVKGERHMSNFPTYEKSDTQPLSSWKAA